MDANEIAFGCAIAGGLVSGVPASILSYRQGQRRAEKYAREQYEKRIRNVEEGLFQVQTLIKLRRQIEDEVEDMRRRWGAG